MYVIVIHWKFMAAEEGFLIRSLHAQTHFNRFLCFPLYCFNFYNVSPIDLDIFLLQIRLQGKRLRAS